MILWILCALMWESRNLCVAIIRFWHHREMLNRETAHHFTAGPQLEAHLAAMKAPRHTKQEERGDCTHCLAAYRAECLKEAFPRAAAWIYGQILNPMLRIGHFLLQIFWAPAVKCLQSASAGKSHQSPASQCIFYTASSVTHAAWLTAPGFHLSYK